MAGANMRAWIGMRRIDAPRGRTGRRRADRRGRRLRPSAPCRAARGRSLRARAPARRRRSCRRPVLRQRSCRSRDRPALRPSAAASFAGIANRADPLRQLRNGEAGAAAIAARLRPAQAHRPDLLRQHDLARAGAAVEMGQQHRRPDRRMAGERQFARRREDAQRAPGASDRPAGSTNTVSGRLNSRAIACMAAVVEAVGLEHDGQRIAGEALRGENVEGEVAAAHVRPHKGSARKCRARIDQFILRLDQQHFARARLGGALEDAEDRRRPRATAPRPPSRCADNARRTAPRWRRPRR